MVPGSGDDLIEFSPTEERPGLPVIIFAARLIAQKGVKEFVEAARLIHLRGVRARFWLAGQPDRFNPSSVSAGDVNKWDKENNVEVLGQISDVAAIYAQAHLVVLPSYYGEGVPKSLLEAAACGRAIVTTDHPGCRDAIRHNETGLLVPVRDSVALANAIQYLIENPFRRREMGYAARRLAEREFAVERVVEAHTRAYEALLENSCG
jgi:glycosyltransferase involved in cell wall biosynthesis